MNAFSSSLYTDMRICLFELCRQSYLALAPLYKRAILIVAAIIYYSLVLYRRDSMLLLPVTKRGLPSFRHLYLAPAHSLCPSQQYKFWRPKLTRPLIKKVLIGSKYLAFRILYFYAWSSYIVYLVVFCIVSYIVSVLGPSQGFH